MKPPLPIPCVENDIAADPGLAGNPFFGRKPFFLSQALFKRRGPGQVFGSAQNAQPALCADAVA